MLFNENLRLEKLLGRMDGQTDGRTDAQTADGRTDRWTDRQKDSLGDLKVLLLKTGIFSHFSCGAISMKTLFPKQTELFLS